jgi:hypothetical protein
MLWIVPGKGGVEFPNMRYHLALYSPIIFMDMEKEPEVFFE